MKGRKQIVGLLLFALLFAMLALGGCGGGSGSNSPANPTPNPSPNPTPQPQAGIFDNWKGTWKSFDDFVDEDAMDPVYAEVAKHASGYTAKGVEGFLEEMYHTDFDSLKVEGSTVAFLDSKGTVKGTLTYVSKGTAKRRIEMGGQSAEIEWHLFEAPAVSGATGSAAEDDSFDPTKSCKYLVMFPVHKDGADGFAHWHMRYGSKSLEALMDSPELSLWWPTLCAPDTKVADIAKDQLAEAKMMATMLPKPLAEWNGTWISAAELHRSPLMQPAYEKIAEEAKKLGKNYTADEVKALYQKTYATPFDRVVVADGLTVQFKKADGAVVATSTYTNDGFAADGWLTWINGTAAGYRTFIATHPHGEGAGKHWHARYADDKTPEELTKVSGWVPTFYDPALTTPEAYAKSYTDGATRRAERLPEKK